MSRRFRFFTILVLTLVGAVPRPRETVTFIVSPRSAVHDLSTAELRRIFLGQTARWPNGHRILVCLRPTNSPEGRVLLDRVVRMSDIDYSQHWIGTVFRGEAASVPHVFDSRESLVRSVAENADAIGFVLASDGPVDPARAITIDGRTPDDPAYAVGR